MKENIFVDQRPISFQTILICESVRGINISKKSSFTNFDMALNLPMTQKQ